MTDPAGATEVRARLVREQLEIALQILDNPGGGLVFGYQALGQAAAQLAEMDHDRWRGVVTLLEEAERQAVWRNFSRSRELIVEALGSLDPATE